MEGCATRKLVMCGHCEQEVSKRTFVLPTQKALLQLQGSIRYPTIPGPVHSITR